MMQWHPLFAQLLRPLLESHYDVQTNVPVGDVPREADVVLIRRTTAAPPPFTGLWRWLTAWNILEFKGLSSSARVDDLDALLELGLGIQRRLQAEETGQRVGRADVSLWYLANHLGRRFLTRAEAFAGPLEQLANGVWRARAWHRSLVLVSNRLVAVERDSLPVHVLTAEPLSQQRELVEVLAQQPRLWEQYGNLLASLHPLLEKEMEAMGKTKTKGLEPDFRVCVRLWGWQSIVRQTGLQGLIEELTPEQRQEALRLLEKSGTPRPKKPRSKSTNGGSH